MKKLPQTLTTKKLKKMSREDLVKLADSYAARLLWLNGTGKEQTDRYKRMAGELWHIAAIIDEKDLEKDKKPKVDYGK